MSNINMLRDAKITRVANSAVAAQTAVTSSVLDMQGYDSVLFIALLGTVTDGSVLTLTGKENTANSTTVPTPLADPVVATKTAATDSNKVMALDFQKPRNRYVFCVLTRTAQNAVVDGILAIQYNSQNKPNLDALLNTLFTAWGVDNDPAAA